MYSTDYPKFTRNIRPQQITTAQHSAAMRLVDRFEELRVNWNDDQRRNGFRNNEVAAL